jgi:hypothetical protein
MEDVAETFGIAQDAGRLDRTEKRRNPLKDADSLITFSCQRCTNLPSYISGGSADHQPVLIGEMVFATNAPFSRLPAPLAAAIASRMRVISPCGLRNQSVDQTR